MSAKALRAAQAQLDAAYAKYRLPFIDSLWLVAWMTRKGIK